MSLVLDATVGGASSNAYASLATVGLFLEENIHISATWAALSTVNRTACIIYATSLLDAQINWIGTKANDSDTQALRWPRTDAEDMDGYAIDDDIHPTWLQKATAFYAYFLSQSNRVSEVDTFGFKRLDAGSLRMDIDKYDRKTVLPNIVWDLVKPYGTKMTSAVRVLERR